MEVSVFAENICDYLNDAPGKVVICAKYWHYLRPSTVSVISDMWWGGHHAEWLGREWFEENIEIIPCDHLRSGFTSNPLLESL